MHYSNLYITHIDYRFLLLRPKSELEWPLFWTIENYCQITHILPTTLLTILFTTFCIFGTFLSPIAMHHIHMTILYIFANPLKNALWYVFLCWYVPPLLFCLFEKLHMHGLVWVPYSIPIVDMSSIITVFLVHISEILPACSFFPVVIVYPVTCSQPVLFGCMPLPMFWCTYSLVCPLIVYFILPFDNLICMTIILSHSRLILFGVEVEGDLLLTWHSICFVDMLHIFHILLIPSFLHKSFTIGGHSVQISDTNG